MLRDLAFTLPAGTVGALVGPSGCGKTTLLRIITGLDRDFAGTVKLPDHGKLGMVFQEPRLLPWRRSNRTYGSARQPPPTAGLMRSSRRSA